MNRRKAPRKLSPLGRLMAADLADALDAQLRDFRPSVFQKEKTDMIAETTWPGPTSPQPPQPFTPPPFSPSGPPAQPPPPPGTTPSK
jgi:hypothetical protein